MKNVLVVLLAFAILPAASPLSATDALPPSTAPALVELFTSEGCSSCPPADALLQQLDSSLPTSVIVLSEHVDYWNHLGWKDRFSSHVFSDRQREYENRFRLQSVYTPEMVVDGDSEFLGNNAQLANQALQKAWAQKKVGVRITDSSVEAAGLRVQVETDPLPASAKRADLYLAVALDHAESQVGRGENAGRKLSHVGVVLKLTRVGAVRPGKALAQEFHLSLDRHEASSKLRVIAFLQEGGEGRVLGAAMRELAVNSSAEAAR